MRYKCNQIAEAVCRLGNLFFLSVIVSRFNFVNLSVQRRTPVIRSILTLLFCLNVAFLTGCGGDTTPANDENSADDTASQELTEEEESAERELADPGE